MTRFAWARVGLLLAAFSAWSPGSAARAAEESATAAIKKLLVGLPVGTPGEYEKIPDIWRAALAAAKRNNAAELQELLEFSTPQMDEKPTDWQVVVIGGGVINGLTQVDVWPRPRLAELMKNNKPLQQRWARLIELSSKMADDEQVTPGTRYDALRILGVEQYKTHGKQLEKYLTNSNYELQMGGVSGLVDVDSPEAVAALIRHMRNYNDENRAFAINGLLRSPARREALTKAMAEGKVTEKDFTPEQLARYKGK